LTEGAVTSNQDDAEVRAASHGFLAFAVIATSIATTVVVLIGSALARGQDWSFDSHSYHTVYAYATLFERSRVGLKPLSLGAYFNPLLDLPLGWGVRHLGPRTVSAGLAFVQSIALISAGLLPWRVLTGTLVPSRKAGGDRRVDEVVLWTFVYAFAVIVAFGAAGRVQLGATFGDMTSVVPAMFGMHVLVAWGRHPRDRQLIWAGALFGLAGGLKYTNGPALVGGLLFVATATIVSSPAGSRARAVVRAAMRYVTGTAVGFGAAGGPWCISLWVRFGNPLFPFGGERLNPAMRTVDGEYVDLGAHAFPMRSATEYVALPLRLLVRGTSITEFPMRDIRILVAFLSAIACIAIAVLRRPPVRETPLDDDDESAQVRAIAFAVSGAWVGGYISWAYLFGNGRYVEFLELLTPTIIVAAFAYFRTKTHRSSLRQTRTIAAAAALLGAVAMVATPLTVSPSWPRVPFASRWYDLDVSSLPALHDAMVIVPYEFEPLDFAEFVLKPKSYTRLHSTLIPTTLGQDEIDRIHAFEGPLYSFQLTDAGDVNLAAVGLRRTDECYPAALAQGLVLDLCRLEIQ
jgi:hypothetical protein